MKAWLSDTGTYNRGNKKERLMGMTIKDIDTFHVNFNPALGNIRISPMWTREWRIIRDAINKALGEENKSVS